jgi:hypothetical protein
LGAIGKTSGLANENKLQLQRSYQGLSCELDFPRSTAWIL